MPGFRGEMISGAVQIAVKVEPEMQEDPEDPEEIERYSEKH